jgi:hypothetical protein
VITVTNVSSAWLAIMAVCLAAALAIWLTLVFLAARTSAGRPQQNSPHREVVGGTFEARHGGRQVMPDPTEPIRHEPGTADRVPGQRRSSEAAKTATRAGPG